MRVNLRYIACALLAFFCLPVVAADVKDVKISVAQTSFRKDTFNILKYNAKGDGKTLNTKSINDAINACSAKGGGVVLIPSGIFLTGPIQLKNNVNLHLKRDALLLFTDDFTQFPLVKTTYEGLEAFRNQSPISGVNLENIAITGNGIIDGNGDKWRMVKKEKLTDNEWKKLVSSGGLLSEDKKTWYPSEKSLNGSKVKNPGVIAGGITMKDVEDIKDFLRPNLLSLTSCKKILLEGVTFQNSPAWNLHPLLCTDLTVKNLQVKNPWYAQNGDGIDIESCKNVLIENSTFDVGDDGICIKSGRDEEGRKRGVPTENVDIKNCVVYHAHGGFVIGSEMSGGVKNIRVTDCTFLGTDIGLRFKTARGRGGIVENIYVNNINMKDIVGEAILFDMYYAAQDPVAMIGEKRQAPKVEMLPVTEATPQFRNFDIRNVVCRGAKKAIFVRGIPEMNVSNVNLQDMDFVTESGVDLIEAKNFTISNIRLQLQNTKPVFNIENSSAITFNNVSYGQSAEMVFSLNGDRTKNIKFTGSGSKSVKGNSEFNFGAVSSSLDVK